MAIHFACTNSKLLCEIWLGHEVQSIPTVMKKNAKEWNFKATFIAPVLSKNF
jgi:hypothetical protein